MAKLTDYHKPRNPLTGQSITAKSFVGIVLGIVALSFAMMFAGKLKALIMQYLPAKVKDDETPSIWQLAYR